MDTARLIFILVSVVSGRAFLVDSTTGSPGSVSENLLTLLNLLSTENAQQTKQIDDLIKTTDVLKMDNYSLRNETKLLHGILEYLSSQIAFEKNKTETLQTKLNATNKTLMGIAAEMHLLQAENAKLKNESNQLKVALETEKHTTSQLDIDVQYFHQQLSSFSSNLTAMRRKTDTNVVFTARDSSDTMPSFADSLRFHSVVSNVGGAFDGTTGYFICPQDGMYYFIANLYKTRDHTELGCHIMKNGQELVYAYAEDDSTHSNGAGSNAVYVHLMVGDKVWLGHCTGGANVKSETTTFSGALVALD